MERLLWVLANGLFVVFGHLKQSSSLIQHCKYSCFIINTVIFIKSCSVQIPLIAYHPFYSATKSSAVAAGIFVLHKKTDLISAPASCVHLIIIIFFVYFKLLGITDPLLPLENLFKKIFLGGILDQLQETFYGKPEEENGEASGTTSI